MTDPQPEVHTTTTAATPIADSIPAPSTGPVPTSFSDEITDELPKTQDAWVPDVNALQAAKGNPNVWAGQFSELVGHTTGSWIDQGIFLDWLSIYAEQIAKEISRGVLFQVANYPVESNVTGDASLALMAQRDGLVQLFRKNAGI